MVPLISFRAERSLGPENSCSEEKSRQRIARGLSLEGRGHPPDCSCQIADYKWKFEISNIQFAIPSASEDEPIARTRRGSVREPFCDQPG
jgi:hypothetical protein